MASNENFMSFNQLFHCKSASKSFLSMLNNPSVENFMELKPYSLYTPSEMINNNCLTVKTEQTDEIRCHQPLSTLNNQQVVFIVYDKLLTVYNLSYLFFC